MKFKTRLKPSYNTIDLTPLVDVIFLLLIFFIVTSDILPLKSLNIESPQLPRDSLPLTSQLVVVMDAQNVIYLGSKKTIVDIQTFEESLKEEIKALSLLSGNNDPTLVISVDRRVEYGDFLKLFSIAQQCCQKIRLVYKPQDDEAIDYL